VHFKPAKSVEDVNVLRNFSSTDDFAQAAREKRSGIR